MLIKYHIYFQSIMNLGSTENHNHNQLPDVPYKNLLSSDMLDYNKNNGILHQTLCDFFPRLEKVFGSVKDIKGYQLSNQADRIYIQA